MNETKQFLGWLNTKYHKLHQAYEELFWVSYMGDHSVDRKMNQALVARDAFRSNRRYVIQAKNLYKKESSPALRERLTIWLDFFDIYQVPPKANAIRKSINKIESKISRDRSRRKEGYIDPYTNKFIPTSALKMAMLIRTNGDEKIRRACHKAREKLALSNIKDYVKLINLRNRYAQALGYEDFYAYKLGREEGMTKKELFSIFNTVYLKTKYINKKIRTMEKKMPGLRKPWNFGFMMAGSFTKAEDSYFQFGDALERWGRSFAALGIDFKGGVLTLDLLDRRGKHNNGFCHWPTLVRFENNKFKPGSANFTCNVVPGQVGSGIQGYNTLFHEGGHAAHLLNSEQREVALNHEYAPMTASWAEVQSMFMDTMFSSIEWRTRYAKDKKGNKYPLSLFENKLKKTHLLRPARLTGIIFVSNFEKDIYEAKNLNIKKVLKIARQNYNKYNDMTETSLSVLNVPHIYNWESSAGYHGYGLADLALTQWRKYFYKKFGYIVDNPKVGKEMAKVWKLAARKKFADFVKLATGEKLSPRAFLEEVALSIPAVIKRSKNRIKRLKSVKPYTGPINLNAKIRLVDGKRKIADNSKGFADMTRKYNKWLKTKVA